jgi:hypothetical protein
VQRNLRGWHWGGALLYPRERAKTELKNRELDFSMDPLSILNLVGFACRFTLRFEHSAGIATSNYNRLTSVLKFMCSINLFFSV